MARPKASNVVAAIGIVALIAAIAAIAATARSHKPVTVSYVAHDGVADPSRLPGMLLGAEPWSANAANVDERLAADGLPRLGAMEGTALHFHVHLDVLVHRGAVAIPPLIGITTGLSRAPAFAPIHTHDASGVVHVESPEQRAFSLGEVFDVWGVRLDENCVGAYCTGKRGTLRVFANGAAVVGDVRRLELTPHEEIVVAFGTRGELPKPVPLSYGFPVGE